MKITDASDLKEFFVPTMSTESLFSIKGFSDDGADVEEKSSHCISKLWALQEMAKIARFFVNANFSYTKIFLDINRLNWWIKLSRLF